MSFKFMHSKIDTRSSVPSLSDIVKLAQTKKALGGQVKTAAAQVPTKVAKKKEAEEEVESEEKEDGEEKEENAAFPGAAPKFKKKESKASTKVAEKDKEEGESSGQPEAEAKLVNEPKKPEGAKGTGGKKKGEGDEGESSGQLDVEPLHQKGESTGEKPAGLDTQKGGEKGEKKESSARFVRVAELTDKQKSFLRATWSLYWPKSFIDALLAAK